MAVDMFLKIDGIKGESQDDKHKGEIQIESWSWGANQTGTGAHGGGHSAGKVHLHDISITKFVDKASCKLMLACCTGEHLKGALITVRKAGKQPLEYLKIKLQDVLITSVQQAGHGSEHITENVTLNFAQVNMEYQHQKQDGTGEPGGEFGYNVKTNKAT
jgi:type VI secretion system secreted protein Hcp